MNIHFDPISYPMMIILFLSFGMIIFLLLLEPRILRRKLVNKNEHGSSKFADIKEIKNNFDKENLNHINKVGFPVWYEKINGRFENVYFDTKSPHYLLVGSTGSGKSSTVSIPASIHFAIAKEKHSVVMTDPKGELFKATGKIFEENGFDIVTIDFRNPSQSTKINIMQPIIDEWKEHCHYDRCMMFFLSYFLKINKVSLEKLNCNEKYLNQINNKYHLDEYMIDIIKSRHEEIKNNLSNKKIYEFNELQKYIKEDIKTFLSQKSNDEILNFVRDSQNQSAKHQAETNRLIISLANLIFAEKDARDPFWINAAKQLFIGIVGIFIEDYKAGLIDENKINISSVKKFQNSSLIKENQAYLQKNLNTRSYGSLTKDYLTSIISAAENTYKSITAIFGEKMSIFDDLNVENITSVSEFKFTNIGKKPTVLYIIVPDEDKAYFQLVTIIIGMLIKDLTKYANLPENNGSLPIKVEWILDEFANCPPLDSIETVVSVARSRGMRFYFFIQSFSQLNQVYGKEIANIIQDNCALVYLKTNTVETAEIISKKLGRSTVVTNSMSMSTDPFKVGANQTKSLMGKELLTANEIIGLKYKTIIFPTIGNPIFRDTYLYGNIYPQYKNCTICNRPIKTLKRITKNYYTVEKMKEVYMKLESNIANAAAKQLEISFNKTTGNKIKNIMKDIAKDETIPYVQDIYSKLRDKIINQYNENNMYVFELSSLLNKFEISKLIKNKPIDLTVEIAENFKTKKTILSVWYDKDYKKENKVL